MEGLCQECKEWVVPDEVRDKEGNLEDIFCPICGQPFIDIHDRDIYKGEK